jgi:hypothetical protein
VWPDNLVTVNAFIAMLTQWRVGMQGAIGLDYGVIPVVLELTQTPAAAWPEVFEGLRVMEEAALRRMRELSTKQ